MLTRRIFLASVLAATSLAQVHIATSTAAAGTDEHLVISDARGDNGLLAPYTHAVNGPGYLYTSYVFDALLDQGPDGGLVPGLAQSWEVSEDLKTYDLKLNSAARWHDGTPVTADDVAFTFDYMQQHPHPFVTLDSVGSVGVIARDHVRITLHQSDTGFLSNTLISMMILPRHIYWGQQFPARFGDPAAATGSGPYRLVSFDKAQGRYLLERNPQYYRGMPRFAQVAIVRMTPEAAIQAYRRGDVDVLSDLPFELMPLAEAASVKVLKTPSNHPERLAFNHRGLFASRKLRYALAHSIDRDRVASIAYPAAGMTASVGYFQPGSPWRSIGKTAEYPFDLARAATLFTEEGWTQDDKGRWHADGKPVQLRLLTDNRFKRVATIVAEQLEQSGIGVDLRLLELAALQQQVQSDEFDLMLRPVSTIGDPGAIIGRVLGKSWTNDRFPDRDNLLRPLLEAQAATPDPEKRLDLLRRFDALYAEELPALMLVNAIWATGHNSRVSPAYLPNGVANGIPMALHKSMFFR